MPRYALLIEYDGTGFEGWQSQPSGKTIQDELESALATCLRTETPVTGSGRTDSGVHARFQIAHFEKNHPLDEARTLVKSLNGLLPSTIAVKDIAPVRENFHARYDAELRTYRYYVSTRPVAIEFNRRVWLPSFVSFAKMNETCEFIAGKNDFTSFCRTQSETINRVCTVTTARWIRENRYNHFFEIAADRFLHGMVRAIVGTMIEIGSDRLQPEAIKRILEERDRRSAGPTAQAKGLVLHRVDYPDGTLPFNY